MDDPSRGQGEGLAGTPDYSIKIQDFGSRAHPHLGIARKRRREQEIPPESSIKNHEISPSRSTRTKSSGEIWNKEKEREGRKSAHLPTELQRRGQVTTASGALPWRRDSGTPRRIKKLPERSREHQSGEGGTAGGGGSRTPNAQREESAWGSRTERGLWWGGWWCGVGSWVTTARRGWVEVEGRKHPDLPRASRVTRYLIPVPRAGSIAGRRRPGGTVSFLPCFAHLLSVRRPSDRQVDDADCYAVFFFLNNDCVCSWL